ncbi:hypothetical protein M8J76_010386 [Diaphorina citri]|nr:hypothetical protein M8J76_010386 [Diaphorina citri]
MESESEYNGHPKGIRTRIQKVFGTHHLAILKRYGQMGEYTYLVMESLSRSLPLRRERGGRESPEKRGGREGGEREGMGASIDHRTLASIDHRTLASIDHRTLASIDHRTLASIDHRTLASIDHRTLASMEKQQYAQHSSGRTKSNGDVED